MPEIGPPADRQLPENRSFRRRARDFERFPRADGSTMSSRITFRGGIHREGIFNPAFDFRE